MSDAKGRAADRLLKALEGDLEMRDAT